MKNMVDIDSLRPSLSTATADKRSPGISMHKIKLCISQAFSCIGRVWKLGNQ